MKTELRYPPQSAPSVGVPSLLDEAWRLQPFVPPFAFSAFFSPEDTLLSVCAADAARHLMVDSAIGSATHPAFHVAELTSGSGLVGLYILGRECNATLLGLDIDSDAKLVAERNALLLGLTDRARFAQSDIWSPATLQLMEANRPQMIICNPPYIPEPPGTTMQVEAGAGADGTAHVMRALELTGRVRPDTLALSWCSLSYPAGVVRAAETTGYELDSLFVTAIADGEYSGTVHSYLQSLGECFINEQSETLDLIAPDPSARFAFLLLAGTFRRRGLRPSVSAAAAVRQICDDFAHGGVPTLASATAPFDLHCSVLNRWDELQLRVLLHGGAPVTGPALE